MSSANKHTSYLVRLPSYKDQALDSDAFTTTANVSDVAACEPEHTTEQVLSPPQEDIVAIAEARLVTSTLETDNHDIVESTDLESRMPRNRDPPGFRESVPSSSPAGSSDMMEEKADTKASMDEKPVPLPVTEMKTGQKTKKLIWIAVAAAVVAVVAIVVGVGVVVVQKPKASIHQVGVNNGSNPLQFFGAALAMSETGDRMAVASAGSAVQMFERDGDTGWKPLGQKLSIVPPSKFPTLTLLSGDLTSVAMNDAGDFVAIGFGAAFEERGAVEIHQLVQSQWIRVGQRLVGEIPGGQFGRSVSLSKSGRVIAIGSPSPNNATGFVQVYQLNSDYLWGLQGSKFADTMRGSGLTVSISGRGDRVAVAGLTVARSDGTKDQESPAIQIFESTALNDFEWTEIGASVFKAPTVADIGWYVDMAGDGDRIVVSNAYLNTLDYVNEDPEALLVQVYQFESNAWRQLGDTIHSSITGRKSGYVVSFSDDGNKIAMGDSGTSEGGRSRGHVHLYAFQNGNWVQIGEDFVVGGDGDRFGFSVAISGDGSHISCGAPFTDFVEDNAGRVHILKVDGNALDF